MKKLFAREVKSEAQVKQGQAIREEYKQVIREYLEHVVEQNVGKDEMVAKIREVLEHVEQMR